MVADATTTAWLSHRLNRQNEKITSADREKSLGSMYWMMNDGVNGTAVLFGEKISITSLDEMSLSENGLPEIPVIYHRVPIFEHPA